MIPAGPRQIIGRIDRASRAIVVEIPDLHHLVLAAGEQGEIVLPDEAAHPRMMAAGLDHEDRRLRSSAPRPAPLPVEVRMTRAMKPTPRWHRARQGTGETGVAPARQVVAIGLGTADCRA